MTGGGVMKRFALSDAFIRGFGRAIDLGTNNVSYVSLNNGRIADYEALRGDWENVGKAIKEQTDKYAAETFRK